MMRDIRKTRIKETQLGRWESNQKKAMVKKCKYTLFFCRRHFQKALVYLQRLKTYKGSKIIQQMTFPDHYDLPIDKLTNNASASVTD